MAALDVAGTVANVKAMLQALSAWQSICDVSTAAEAGERIYYGGVDEDASETLTPCIILDIDPLQSEWIQDTARGLLVVEVRIELSVPPANCATFGDQYQYVWTQVAALLAGINGAVNGSGQLMLESLDMVTKPMPIDPDDNHGRIEWGTILSLSIRLI